MADETDRKAAAPRRDPPDDPRSPTAAGSPETKGDRERRIVPPFPPAELVSPHGAG